MADETVQVMICPKCKRVLSEDEFWKGAYACKECSKKRYRDWYQKNRERQKKYNNKYYKEWYLKNKGKRRQYNNKYYKKWYLKNKKIKDEYSREWYQKNKHLANRGEFKSSYEKVVSNILKKYGVEYVSEYRLEGCVHVYTLRVDFYVPDYDLIIEVHGKQHYEPIEHFGGEEGLEYTKIRDKKKFDHADKKMISYVELPYWMFESEGVVDEILKLHLEVDVKRLSGVSATKLIP